MKIAEISRQWKDMEKMHHGTIHEKTYLLAVEMAKNQIKGWEEDETRAKKVRG